MFYSFSKPKPHWIFLIIVCFSFLPCLGMINPLSSYKIPNAGILPWTVHEGKIWFLFGLEKRAYAGWVWTDFGGKCEGNETIAQCAGREGSEELRRLHSPEKFEQKIEKNFIIINDQRNYAVCFPQIEWIEDLSQFAQRNTNGTDWEKHTFRWILAQDLMQAIDSAKHLHQADWAHNVFLWEKDYPKKLRNESNQSTLLYHRLATILNMAQTRIFIEELLHQETPPIRNVQANMFFYSYFQNDPHKKNPHVLLRTIPTPHLPNMWTGFYQTFNFASNKQLSRDAAAYVRDVIKRFISIEEKKTVWVESQNAVQYFALIGSINSDERRLLEDTDSTLGILSWQPVSSLVNAINAYKAEEKGGQSHAKELKLNNVPIDPELNKFFLNEKVKEQLELLMGIKPKKPAEVANLLAQRLNNFAQAFKDLKAKL